MRKIQKERGITLVALIITIVILLILATVAITSIEKGGIINYAENAQIKWNQEETKEQTFLNEYLNILDNVNGPKIITFKIGNTSYQAEEGMTWAVWVTSDYNTTKGNENQEIKIRDGNAVIEDRDNRVKVITVEEYTAAKATDPIQSGHNYGIAG